MAVLNDLAKPVVGGGIGADEADLGGALLAQQIEKAVEGLLVMSLGRPYQPARVVVDDHGQAAVAPPVGDLVEGVGSGSGLAHDPGHDGTHGGPGDAQKFGMAVLEVCVASQATVSSKRSPPPVPKPSDSSGT